MYLFTYLYIYLFIHLFIYVFISTVSTVYIYPHEGQRKWGAAFPHGPMGDLPLLRHLSHHKVLLGCGRRHLKTLRTSLEHSLEQIIQGKLFQKKWFRNLLDTPEYLFKGSLILEQPTKLKTARTVTSYLRYRHLGWFQENLQETCFRGSYKHRQTVG